MGRPTIEDVAARAGVSRALVSLVMRGSPKVSEARRAAVLAAAEELGYSPHAMARSLASPDVARARRDGVGPAQPVLGRGGGRPRRGTRARRASSWSSTPAGGGPSRERQALTGLLSFRPAGIALLGPVVPAGAIAAAAAHTPVVLVSRSSRASTVDTVNDDGQAGSGMAVDHLVVAGPPRDRAHRRRRRFAGGTAAHGLRERDAPPRPDAARGPRRVHRGGRARGDPLTAAGAAHRGDRGERPQRGRRALRAGGGGPGGAGGRVGGRLRQHLAGRAAPRRP